MVPYGASWSLMEPYRACWGGVKARVLGMFASIGIPDPGFPKKNPWALAKLGISILKAF